jgi:uncharacterized protein YcfJ
MKRKRRRRQEDAKFTIGGMGVGSSFGAVLRGPKAALLAGITGGYLGYKIDKKRKHRRHRKEDRKKR